MMQREREVQWYKAYRRVIFLQSLSANNSRQIGLFKLQKLNKSCSVAATGKKSAHDFEGTSKVSIESQPNLYHSDSTPILVKNDNSTDEVWILFFRSRISPTCIDSDGHSFMETPANHSSTTRSADECH
jgi:hypothetical protein